MSGPSIEPLDERPTGEVSDYGDHSYANMVEQQRLCQGSAADVFLVSRQQIRAVKKVMRVSPSYFGGGNASSRQKALDEIHAGFSKVFGRWHLLGDKSSDFDNHVKVFFIDTKALTLYKEYCAYGDLREYSRRITNNLARKAVFQGLISGLHFLHSQNPPITHGCVNPGNIYITRGGTVKLGEPSFSQLVVEHSHLTPSISVDWLVRWMSPEYFEEPQPEPELDIWSLGCTFLEVMTGRLPYDRYKSNTEVLEQILTGVPPDLGVLEYPVVEPETYPGFISQLAKKCWLPAPTRPDSSHIYVELSKWDDMDHRFISRGNAPGSAGSPSMRGSALRRSLAGMAGPGSPGENLGRAPGESGRTVPVTDEPRELLTIPAGPGA